MRTDSVRGRWRTALITAVVAVGAAASAAAGVPAPLPSSAASPAAPVDGSEVRFIVGESSLLDWLRAATPYAVTIGTRLVRADLILLDPTDLHLKDGKATLRIRAKGTTLPIDQTLTPVITLAFDREQNAYFGVLSSLPLAIPGLGSVDLKEFFPRFAIPAVLENLWRFADKPVGLNLKIHRIAILDRALEVGAEITFAPIPPVGARSARQEAAWSSTW